MFVLEDRACTIVYGFRIQICVPKNSSDTRIFFSACVGNGVVSVLNRGGYSVIKTVGLLTGSVGSLGRMLTAILQGNGRFTC